MSNISDWVISWTLGRMISAGESLELAAKRFALFCLLCTLWLMVCWAVIYPALKYTISAVFSIGQVQSSVRSTGRVAPRPSQPPCTVVGTRVTREGGYTPICQ